MISPLMILLIVLVVLALSGSGYGYYHNGAYASPLGMLGAVLVVCLILWLVFGGVTVSGPPY